MINDLHAVIQGRIKSAEAAEIAPDKPLCGLDDWCKDAAELQYDNVANMLPYRIRFCKSCMASKRQQQPKRDHVPRALTAVYLEIINMAYAVRDLPAWLLEQGALTGDDVRRIGKALQLLERR